MTTSHAVIERKKKTVHADYSTTFVSVVVLLLPQLKKMYLQHYNTIEKPKIITIEKIIMYSCYMIQNICLELQGTENI